MKAKESRGSYMCMLININHREESLHYKALIDVSPASLFFVIEKKQWEKKEDGSSNF